MGYKRHLAIIVSSSNPTDLAQAHATALGLFEQKVTPILAADINGIETFFVGPSGTQWDDVIAEAWEKAQAKLIWFMNKYTFEDGSSTLDWILVEYASDGGPARILLDSNASDQYEVRKSVAQAGESVLARPVREDDGPGPTRLPDVG